MVLKNWMTRICRLRIHPWDRFLSERKWKGKSLSRVWLFVNPWIYSPWHSLGQNTAVGSRSLLQEIFPTQGLNPGLPHCRQILYQLSHKGDPMIRPWDFGLEGCCKLAVRTIWKTGLHMLFSLSTWVLSRSVMSYSFWPHGLWPTRLLCLTESHSQLRGDLQAVGLIPYSRQRKVFGKLRNCSLLTPLVVNWSRIQVCGDIQGCCAKISTQTYSDQWNTLTYKSTT